jgi:molybdate transport system substrate-binding protein
MRVARKLAGVLVLAVVAAAAPARAEELLVAAAASLTDTLQEVGRAHAARTGTTVEFNFGPTGALTKQLLAGAPADAFFSADVEHVVELERAGLVAPGARVELLSNVLVVIVPSDSRLALAAAADLVPLPKLALADPESVPAGTYARTWLQSRGVWEKLREHVVPTLDVRAALAAVEGAHADAGVVYRTDAAVSKRVRVAFEVPAAEGPRIVYALAPLAKAKPATAELMRTLASPEARAVYRRYGFAVLGGT